MLVVRIIQFLIIKINRLYIRQTPIQKILGLQNLIIRFDSEEKREQISIKAFGFSYQYYGLIYFPGVWGELLTVPSLNKKYLKLMTTELQKRKPVSIEHIGIGYPIHGKVVKYRFILAWILLLILLILLILVRIILSFQINQLKNITS